jgi:putative ABC transport system permease protein
MYSAVSERGREIATMRAVGFSSSNVILSFLFESLVIAFLGGILGCLVVLPLNGLTTSTMNFQTFSNVAFAFKITFDLLIMGVLFALVMGVLGGLLPAIRAALQPVSVALREL